ncbi:MAG: hypothetical protein QNJ15_02075 [Erythrobacter sp.]|nr:hypothetical protein [Erythrobacter sp.]
MSQGLDKIVAMGPPKEAALYFDRVCPLDLGTSLFHSQSNTDSGYIPFDDARFDESVVKSLLGSDGPAIYTSLVNANFIYQIANKLSSPASRKSFRENSYAREFAKFMNEKLGVDLDKLADDIESGQFDVEPLLKATATASIKVMDDHGFGNVPIWNLFSNEELDDAKANDSQRFYASLAGLELIDPEKTSWKQVVEFREDQLARNALRDLRLFFQENFDGKSKAYIEDSLAQKIERYEEARKLWGFETAQRSLSVLFNEKSVIASSVGSIAAHTVGGSLLAAAGVGGVIALGGVALELGRVYIDQRRARIKSPVRYLSNLKSLNNG